MKKVTLFLQKHLFVLASMTISIPATTRNKTPIIEIPTHEFHSLGSRRDEDMPKSVFSQIICFGPKEKIAILYMAMAEKTLKSDRGWIFPSLLGEGVGVFLIEF